jgi:hypothetical protein
MRLLRRLLAAIKSQPAPVVPAVRPVPSRSGQEVWGATRPAPTGGWREVGRIPGESIFGESWTPRETGLSSGRGLRDEAVGSPPAAFSSSHGGQN